MGLIQPSFFSILESNLPRIQEGFLNITIVRFLLDLGGILGMENFKKVE
jgi:hypothetical protein